MGKQSAPAAPDYAAAATAQGDANLAAGQQTAALNRPDQVDSNGSQTWSLKDGADPKNPQAGDWTVTNKLNDTQQALKDQQDALSSQYGNLAASSLSSIGGTLGTKFDASGLPQASSLSTDGLSPYGTLPGQAQHQLAPGTSQNSYLNAPNQNRAQLSTAGLSAYGSVAPSTEQSRQNVTNALYARQTAALDPQTQQQTSDLTSRLASQGITEGSDAYNRASDNLARQQADAYASARNDSITAGGAEDSRITNENLGVANFDNATRGQQFGEQQAITDNQNANADALFSQNAQAAGFNNDVNNNTFTQGLASAGFNNSANDTGFNQGMSQYTGANATQAQQFNERSTANSANNTLHSNALTEALQQRQLGLNEANALRTGNQVGTTQFQPYGGGGQIAAAPVYQATADNYNAQLAGVNANNAGAASTFNGLTSLGSAFLLGKK